MSIKAYNRGTEVIRRYSKKEEVAAGRILDRMNADMSRLERENETLKAELEKTRAELERARAAYHRRSAEVEALKEEIRAQQEDNKREHKHYIDCFRALVDSRKGHQKLTAVMKIALTPEQYHDARARAADLYTELFADKGES